jgi:hypothetical protein
MRPKSEGTRSALVRESEAAFVSSSKVSYLPVCLLTCPSPKLTSPATLNPKPACLSTCLTPKPKSIVYPINPKPNFQSRLKPHPQVNVKLKFKPNPALRPPYSFLVYASRLIVFLCSCTLQSCNT